jgi:glycosyltransferase involved in cell wall biosynthesis
MYSAIGVLWALVGGVVSRGVTLVSLVFAGRLLPSSSRSLFDVPHLTVELQVATGLVLFGTINGVQMGALVGFGDFRTLAVLNSIRGVCLCVFLTRHQVRRLPGRRHRSRIDRSDGLTNHVALGGLLPETVAWQHRGAASASRQPGNLYLRAVEESQLNAIYNLADVFVMPTRACEMFGMAAVEAQACGRPVVSRDAGGLKKVLLSNRGARRPGQDGGRDRETVDDANLYAVCSANALINVATYDWSRICDRCDELYRAAS